MMVTWLVSLWACSAGPVEHDHHRYMRSITHPEETPEASARVCSQLLDPVLQGECNLFAAARVARSGADARPLCTATAHSAWREACFFEIADAMSLRGEAARTACAQAGQFQTRCLAHALNRDAPEAAESTSNEAAMLTVLTRRARALGLAGAAASEAAQDVVAQHIAGQWSPNADNLFSRTDCGRADSSTCKKAYRLVVKNNASGQQLRRPCAAHPVDRVVVAEAGLPVWSDDLAVEATEVWGGICR